MSTISKPLSILTVIATVLAVALTVVFAVAYEAPAQQCELSAKEQAVRNILRQFEKDRTTKLLSGDIRPIDDKGWMKQMEALVELVKAGPDAVPVLVDALKNGSRSSRQFAAQVLAAIADPDAQPALEKAISDPDAVVRMYAIEGLSMLGPLEPTEENLRILEEDPNRFGVRSHMAAALERSDPPNPAAHRKTLTDYNLGEMDTARVGQVSPDFSLTDLMGDAYRLSQFRGKKTVVLMFVMVDC